MIEEVGVLAAREVIRGNHRLKIEASTVLEGLNAGDSIAVSGPCLTVTEVGGGWFRVEATGQTAAVSTIGNWQAGRKVNLERALKVGDRLGGHIVQGHIDGVGRVVRVNYRPGSTLVVIETPPKLTGLLAPKGSVAVDGVSLTIAEKSARRFTVMLIPFTMEHTTLDGLRPGSEVNIETDLIIRWLADRFPDGEVVGGPGGILFDPEEIHLED